MIVTGKDSLHKGDSAMRFVVLDPGVFGYIFTERLLYDMKCVVSSVEVKVLVYCLCGFSALTPVF